MDTIEANLATIFVLVLFSFPRSYDTCTMHYLERFSEKMAPYMWLLFSPLKYFIVTLNYLPFLFQDSLQELPHVSQEVDSTIRKNDDLIPSIPDVNNCDEKARATARIQPPSYAVSRVVAIGVWNKWWRLLATYSWFISSSFSSISKLVIDAASRASLHRFRPLGEKYGQREEKRREDRDEMRLFVPDW